MSTVEGRLRRVRKDIVANTIQVNSGELEGNDSPNNPTNNFSATVDPTTTDDSSEGYSVGSRWINTTSGNVFTCVDTTQGAAVWTAGSGGETFTTITMATSGADPSHNITGPGTYLVEKTGSGASTGIFDFIPQDGDIVKIIYKSAVSGGAISFSGSTMAFYDPPILTTTARANLSLPNVGNVAFIQYFGNLWYPLNASYQTLM